MSSNLQVYLPQDRLRALANGATMPDRTQGAALFADISGFTTLTEHLTKTLGSRLGVEELTKRLDVVYAALIAQVERHGGSVIGFAGDAITCWFDEKLGQATTSAIACAQDMQIVMRDFPELSLKIAVTAGAARRFVVGDPAIQRIDTLAGATIARLATAEQLAEPGEIVVDGGITAVSSTAILQQRTTVRGETFSILKPGAKQITANSIQTDPISIADQILEPWLLPDVFAREQSGQGAFLTEFRPCVALFIRFVGIDYDADDAETKLDIFVRQLQTTVAFYEGTLLQITIGDKGSYAYVCFGALSVHEDDVHRAIKTALDIRREVEALGFLAPLQLGLTRGIMRVGTYGGFTRRTYGAQGDDVNLAARLMQTAVPGEILVSGRIQKMVADDFVLDAYEPIVVKGKTSPISIFAIKGVRQSRAIRLQEPAYTLPMVGRQRELETIIEKMDLALHKEGQVVGIVAEAGMGKSRFMAEVIRRAQSKGFAGYGGACQSYGINSPYLVWKPIWSAFFDVDPVMSKEESIPALATKIEELAPDRVQSIPLLAQVLDISHSLPENDFTQMLDPEIRKSALYALLKNCLKVASEREPLLLIFEDMHWMDTLSQDLLEELARVIKHFSVMLLLAYRPQQYLHETKLQLETLPYFTEIKLGELSPLECEQVIRTKLAQLYPIRSDSVPPVLVEKLVAKTQGNPFFLEEVLNLFHDRGYDPRNPLVLNQLDLPDSLHALILSRIDQLTDREKTTLRVASVIGRLFRAAWLAGYYPSLGDLPQLKMSLNKLHVLDITPLETPEPELTYLFKHIVTHEVAYESLAYATRAWLHEQLAQYLEANYATRPLWDTLAYHYGQSTNTTKQREYFEKAGEAARVAFANDTALDYYARLMPLLTDADDQLKLHLQWASVLELVGRWDEAEHHYQEALEMSAANPARCQFALGRMFRLRGDYTVALDWLARARAEWLVCADGIGLSQALMEIGYIYWHRGDYAAAQVHLEDSLDLAREAGDWPGVALSLNYLGNVCTSRGDYEKSRTLHTESLTLKRQLNDKKGISISLNNLGNVAFYEADYVLARALYTESLALKREMGNKAGISASLNNLGHVASNEGDYASALSFYAESLALKREMGDKRGIADSLNSLGRVAYHQGDNETARTLLSESLELRRSLGNKRGVAASLHGLGLVALSEGEMVTARKLLEESLSLRQEMKEKIGVAVSLNSLGLMLVREGDWVSSRVLLVESLNLSREIGAKKVVVLNLIGLACAGLGEGVYDVAVQLLAVSEALRGEIGLVLELMERQVYKETAVSLRNILGEEKYKQAWSVGEKMTLVEAVELALRNSS